MIVQNSSFQEKLEQARAQYRFPSKIRHLSERFARYTLSYLFPQFERVDDEHLTLDAQWTRIEKILDEVVIPLDTKMKCKSVREHFKEELPGILQALTEDAEAILRADPAAESLDEVILAYPGFYAMAIFRIAHSFYGMGIPFFPRLLSEFAHRETGIDIHPGAKIGHGFSIDHGTGIVIGETTIIGDHVRIFQGVTLGALSVDKALADTKRHPTIEDDVVIYANATILGGKTVVGKGSIIGGNVWLTRSVPAGSTVSNSGTIKSPGQQEEELLDFQI
jgi:serine O-acetyltransferase